VCFTAACKNQECPAYFGTTKSIEAEARAAWNRRADGWVKCSAGLPDAELSQPVYVWANQFEWGVAWYGLEYAEREDKNAVAHWHVMQHYGRNAHIASTIIYWRPLPEAPEDGNATMSCTPE
jgi:hypothetical protein